jgi:hypothetical protein
MRATRDEETFRRAGQIVAQSGVAALVEGIVCRSVATIHASRSFAVARRRVREFQAMPADERGWCVILLVAAALAGHIVMAAVWPAPAKPTVTLTALALVAAGLAAILAAVRSG